MLESLSESGFWIDRVFFLSVFFPERDVSLVRSFFRKPECEPMRKR